MGKSRIDEAAQLLLKVKDIKKRHHRKQVLRAVRHLIAWLGGKKELPTPNAINTDDDSVCYCDLCFVTPIPMGRELCTTCDPPEKRSGARFCPLERDQRRKREEQMSDHYAPVVAAHQEAEMRRFKR